MKDMAIISMDDLRKLSEAGFTSKSITILIKVKDKIHKDNIAILNRLGFYRWLHLRDMID